MMLYTQKYRCGWVIISLLLAFLWVGRNDLYAQEQGCIVSGRIVSDVPGDTRIVNVPHAGVALISGKDTLWTSGGGDGYFLFKGVRQGAAKIRVTHASYQTFESQLELEEGDNFFIVKLDRITLKESTVISEAPLITHRKDTTIYNGAAVRTMEGDYAIEILRQMPGVEIRSGKIYVDGQLVKRTYVNGRLIFGNGVITPLGSLLAEDVVNIKSYEEESVEAKEMGLNNSLKERVLDITTRNPVFSAFDGYASASAGADEKRDVGGNIQGRYIAGLHANLFSEMLLAYFTGYANNVGWSSDRFTSYNNLPGALQGYQEKASISTGFEKYWGNRLNPTKLGISYSFDKGYNRHESLSRRDYFEAESSPARSTADTLTSSSSNKRHSFDLFFSLSNETVGVLYTKNQIVLGRGESSKLNISSLTATIGEGHYQNRLQSERSQIKKYTSNSWWTKRNCVSGVVPYVNFDVSYGNTGNGGFLVDTLSSTFTKKHLETEGSDKDYLLSFGVSLRKAVINRKDVTLTLMPGYGFSKQHLSKYKMALDMLDPDNPVTDNVNSYNFTWNVLAHGPSMAGELFFQKVKISFTVGVLFNHLLDSEAFPAAYSSRHSFIEPKSFMHFWGGDKFHITLNLSGQLPSVEQLRDRIDDRNPFYLYAGNPGLKQERNNHLMMDVSLLNKGNRRLRFEGDFDIKFNPIIFKQTYFTSDTHLDRWGGFDAKAGSSLTTYENAPLSLTLSPSLKFSDRIQKMRLNYKVTAGARYSLRPQYISDKMVRLNEIVPSYSLWISYAPSSITRVSLTQGVSYVHSFNSLGQTMPPIISTNVGFSGRVLFLKRCIAGVEYSFVANNYIDAAYQDIYLHRLDALVSISLLKGRLGLSISGNDLLNRGAVLTITTNANYQDTAWIPSYGRYFMFNIVYRLNKTSPKTSFMGWLKQ